MYKYQVLILIYKLVCCLTNFEASKIYNTSNCNKTVTRNVSGKRVVSARLRLEDLEKLETNEECRWGNLRLYFISPISIHSYSISYSYVKNQKYSEIST